MHLHKQKKVIKKKGNKKQKRLKLVKKFQLKKKYELSSTPKTNENENKLKLGKMKLNKVSQLETQLFSELRKKSPYDLVITQMRKNIIKIYEDLLNSHFNYACNKDSIQLLWRSVFYKPIEEFRKIIKKYQVKPGYQAKYTNTLKIFKSFLCDSCKYFEKLFSYLSTLLQKQYNRQSVFICMNKCLIMLGDLERYSQLYSTEPVKSIEDLNKKWDVPSKHYLSAIKIFPYSGNAHNQLAVISSYKKDIFEAIYRYYRSLSVTKPFSSAKENLILLFEKNRKIYQKMNLDKQGSNLKININMNMNDANEYDENSTRK